MIWSRQPRRCRLFHEQSDLGRVTKGAAIALRARLLMYNERYADAYAAAQQVMDMNYELYSDYEALFSDYETEINDEVIFSIQYNEEDDVNNWITLDMEPQSAGGWSSQVPTRALIDAYECIDGLTIDESPLYDWTNPYENRDPRLHASIYYPGREYMDGTFNTDPTKTYPDEIDGDKITAGGGQQWNKTSTGYNWVKFVMKQDLGNSGVWTGHGSFPLIRYAEVLLTYAESKIEAGSIDNSVLEAINEVRQRAGMPDVTTMNTTELREIVRRERRVELAIEGLRLYDIRRWRIAEDVMSGPVYGIFYPDPDNPANEFARWVEDRVFASRNYLLPIPQSEIDVSGIEQNLGW